MELETLQKKYDLLYEKVRRTRAIQREYWKYRAGSDKEIMLRLQRELDAMITEEKARREKMQKELF